MKNKKENFKAVEFMYDARHQITEKYQKNKKAFLKDLNKVTEDFIKSRTGNHNISILNTKLE